MQPIAGIQCPPIHCCLAWLITAFLAASAASAAEVPKRQANSTLRMPAALSQNGPEYPYKLVEAWNGLTFDQPVALTSPRGERNRIFVVERGGRILVVTNLAQPTRTTFLDISETVDSDWAKGKVEGLSSLAFHPNYLTSRFPTLYVTYTVRLNGPDGEENYNRLSRFQSTRADPNHASPELETILISQVDTGDGHNFNDLAFGSDGYLYVAVGDEGDGGKGDDFNNAQRIDQDYFSGILRIDVDNRAGNLPPHPHSASTTHYSVPFDNPWVGATEFNGRSVDPAAVRTEFYAVGLRNPWRISFDPVTGDLFAADVGQHGREEINIIVKGGNYGWSFREGTLQGPKGPAPPGLALRDPIHEYSPGYGPDQGFSVTGGVVYHGPALSGLVGAYVFADYVTGNIWALRYDESSGSSVQRLASHAGIAGFGIDPRDGEMLLIDHDHGKIFRLDHSNPAAGADLPLTLSATGAFADLVSLEPHGGILPYEVNVPFWSDGAEKRRWFSLPDLNQAMAFSDEGNWSFPKGAVWIKHFELTNASPESVRRLETRLLVKTEDGVYGVTYRWGDSNSDAVLVPDQGIDEPILVNDGGIIRTQIWHYPSRSECLACHTPAAGFVLGFNTAQLNRPGQIGVAQTNQIYALSAAGYFQSSVSNIHVLSALRALSDETVSRESRVRSYLAANCVACHQPGGSAHAQWDARVTTPLANAGLVDGALYDTRGDPEYRVIQPGSLEHSMLLSRISELGKDHMPPIGSRTLNHEAIRLMTEWVLHDLPNHKTYSDWQQSFFSSSTDAEANAEADPDGDGALNYLEFLTGSHPLQSADVWNVGIQKNGPVIQIRFPQVAHRIFQVQWLENISSPMLWHPLDVPENRPFSASSNRLAIVHDFNTNSAARYYRISVREP